MSGRLQVCAAFVLLVAAAACRADAGMDRQTCLAAMAAYPKIHEALTIGKPMEQVTAIIVAEGRRAGVDKALLAQNAARWAEMLHDLPPQALPTPELVRSQRDAVCGRFPG